MGTITYLAGSRVDGRQDLLAEKMASHRTGSILHLVPTRGRVMDLETEQRFWLRRKVNTLTGIIHRIFEEDIRYRQLGEFTPIDPSIQSLLVKKAIQRRGSQPDGLVYFNHLLSGDDPGRDFPGIYRSVAWFFSRLVRNHYEDRFADELAGRMIRLEGRGQGAGDERYALESDLTWLFGDYEEIKREIQGYDEDDILSHVRRFLIRGGRPSFMMETDAIVFDGYMHLSRVEEDILFHLFGLADQIWWLLDYDGRARDPVAGFRESSGTEGGQPGTKEAYRVFAPAVSLMDRLEKAGFRFRVERADEDTAAGSAASLYIGGEVWGRGKDRLKIRSFAGREAEVRAIASEIKRIVHEENLDPATDLGRIRVIFPDLNDYSSLLSEIFRDYNIPFSLTRGLPLAFHPLSGLFQDIFRTVLNHFRTEELFRILSSNRIRERFIPPQAPVTAGIFPPNREYLLSGDEAFPEEAGSFNPDMPLFKKVAAACGIRSLNDDLSGLSRQGILGVRDLYEEKIHGLGDAEEKDALRVEYYGFVFLAGFLQKKLDPFTGLTRQKSPEGIWTCFSGILDHLGFPENILDSAEEAECLGPAGAREMIKRDFKAYSLLKELLAASARELQLANEFQLADELKLAGTLHQRSGHSLLAEYYTVFARRLGDAYLLDERNPNVIRVSQWLEIRGRAFDYIFAGGMTSDRFPLREEKNFILPESPARAFRTPDPVDQSKYLFSHLLRNYRKGLYLSYPRYAEGKDAQPSQVLTDLGSLVRDDISAGDESGFLEEYFAWEDSPFLSSDREMLNALIKKEVRGDRNRERALPLHQVIPKEESDEEGLIRGARAVLCRWALDGLFEYDGLVTGSDRFKRFTETKKDIFSASQLELLASCPMRYLFERLYGLKSVEEPGAEASPRDMGAYIHTLLHLLFKELCDRGMNIADIGLEKAFSLARETACKVFDGPASLKRLEFFEFQKRELLEGLERDPAVLEAKPEEREGLLALLLRFEEKELGDRQPVGVEYGFGFEDGAAVSLGDMKLRGFIDRFDRDREDENRIYVYDYKSGAVPLFHMVKMGLSFQLPVYVRALRKASREGKISAAFYSLKRNVVLKSGPVTQAIGDRAESPGSLDISGVRLFDVYANALKELLEQGRFHHSADGRNCHYCEFRYACHRDERRMKHLLDRQEGLSIYSGRKNLEKWRAVEDFRKEWKEALKSMQKALTLKTASARTRHAESVLDFRDNIKENRGSLPFHDEYIDELLDRLAEFERRIG